MSPYAVPSGLLPQRPFWTCCELFISFNFNFLPPQTPVYDFGSVSVMLNSSQQVQSVMVQAFVTLLQTHLVAVDRAVGIDPGSFIVTRRFNHKGVSLPVRGRISVPPRLGVIRELAPVRPKVAPYVVPFEEHHVFVGKLDESVVTVVQVAGVP